MDPGTDTMLLVSGDESAKNWTYKYKDLYSILRACQTAGHDGTETGAFLGPVGQPAYLIGKLHTRESHHTHTAILSRSLGALYI